MSTSELGAPARPARLSWREFDLAFGQSPALVAVFSGAEHLLTYQNETSAVLHGRRPLGVPATIAFPDLPDWLARGLRHVYRTGEVARFEHAPLTVRAGGGPRQILLDAVYSPLFDDDGAVQAVLTHSIEVVPHRLGRDELHDAAVLGRASAELSRSLDVEQVTATIARLASEVFDGWCVLDLWEPDGSLRRVTGRHVDPSAQPVLDQLVRLPRVSGLAAGRESIATAVARTGRAAFGRFEAAALAAGAPTPEHAAALRALAPGAYLVVPIEAGPRRLGALTVLRNERGADFTPADRVVAEQFAERAAVALSHARDYDEQRQAILTLQRNMLRPVPPAVPGVRVAVRYRPAGRGASIGGDWYDVFEISDGTLGIVVGDVQGHDIAAAALMGQIRSVVHSHARAGLSPAYVTGHANAFVCEQDDDRLVTMSYLQLHPAERLLIWTRAGHVPAVTVSQGTPIAHEGHGGLPLGVDPGARWLEHTTHVPPEGVTAVFTDGLVESAQQGVTEGVNRLAELLRTHEDEDLECLADRIITELVAGRDDVHDDVALVLFRLTNPLSPGGRRVVRRLPPAASSASVVRHFLHDLLPQWGLPQETIATAALLASEVTTNAARHSDSAIEVRVELGERLRIELYDDSHRMPVLTEAALGDTSGRGLQIVAALSERWGVRPEGSGKAVWFELMAPLHA